MELAVTAFRICGKISRTAVQRMTRKTLKINADTATRLPFRDDDSDARISGTTAPIEVPTTMKTAMRTSSSPCIAKIWMIPTADEELCRTAAMTRPIATARNGFASRSSASITAGEDRSGSTASPISFTPTNSMPKPRMICAAARTRSFFTNR